MIHTIFSGQLPIDEKFLIRKNSYTHGKSHKRFCIVTGTHGDELEGQMVCYEVGRRIKEHLEQLNGTVDIYPSLNPLGIDTIQRGIPNFDLDMNRIFPGSLSGAMAEQAAYTITEDLKGADMVLDVHSSNLYLKEAPQVRINILHEKQLVPWAQRLGIDFIWVHDAATVLESTLAYSLNSTGTPCLVAEMGVSLRINNAMCLRFAEGVMNLLKSMDMWTGPVDESLLSESIVCRGDSVSFLNADASGVFLTTKKAGTSVSKGEVIGEIVDPLTSSILSNVTAPIDGYLFTVRAYPIVNEGSLMARIYNEKQA